MDLTISSIVSTCILISIMILIICPVLRNSFMIHKAGPKCIIFILMCLVIRMFFPIEFWFAHNIRAERLLPYIRSTLNYEISIGHNTLIIWNIFLYIWIAGILGLVGWKLWIYHRMNRLLRILPATDIHDFFTKKGLDTPEDCRDVNVRIVVADFVQTPFQTGIRQGFILLPEYDYSPVDLCHIIRHEVMHYKNRDVYIKMLVDILCTAFWWNLTFYYLKSTIFHLIEISNDRMITKDMTDAEKTSYMDCLANVAEKMNEQDIPFGVSFGKESLRKLKQRVALIQKGIQEQKRFRRGLVLLITVLIVFSFSIILESVSKPPEGIPMTPENTYLIQNGELYDVYVEGEFFFSTDDLTPFPGFKIYENKEEINNE